tara:strand:+ start:225 stop:476 length:252 start_codon:yes stop_codon:yes gene_type:complete
MKFKLNLTILILIVFLKPVYSEEMDCNQFDKLSAKYIECNAKKLKTKTIEKVEIGKDKMESSGINDKIKKFKNSKTLSDLIKK